MPIHVKRPISLVYDGYGIHHNTNIVEKSIEFRIILVILPSNSNHIIQHLGISVFKPFKIELKHQIEKFMIENACTSFIIKDAITISSIGFEKGIINKPENIVAGFKEGGILPVYFPQIVEKT